jgi:hypothetical protein
MNDLIVSFVHCERTRLENLIQSINSNNLIITLKGENVTQKYLDEAKVRLEHANKAIIQQDKN